MTDWIPVVTAALTPGGQEKLASISARSYLCYGKLVVN